MKRGIGSEVERFGQACFGSDPIAKFAPAW
jgi:hypothetical protein